jgi:hypothetical protein
MNKKENTAYHEAGHAVADMRFGFGCGRVTIIANPEENSAGTELSMDYGDADDHDEATTKNHVIVLLAGHEALVEHDATATEDAALGASADFEEAKGLLRRIGLEEDLRPWLVQARNFVRKEWQAIEVLARELLEVNTLDDAEVECILAFVDGDAEAVAQLAAYRAIRGRGPTQQFPFRIKGTTSSSDSQV